MRKLHYALLTLVVVFFATHAKAQIYEPGKMVPILGEIQDGNILGCLELADTEIMVVANMEDLHLAQSIWRALVHEGKCGDFKLPHLFNKVLGEFQIRTTTFYVVEVKVGLTEWPSIYAFVPFKPRGLYLVQRRD